MADRHAAPADSRAEASTAAGEHAVEALAPKLAALDAVIAALDDGGLPLAEALETYERGVATLRQALGALDLAEARLEALLAPADGAAPPSGTAPEDAPEGSPAGASDADGPAGSARSFEAEIEAVLATIESLETGAPDLAQVLALAAAARGGLDRCARLLGEATGNLERLQLGSDGRVRREPGGSRERSADVAEVPE